MVVDLLPLLRQVAANAGDESKIVKYIASYGFKGVPILIGLQALQVITAVIPSAAIQLLTGLCYGVWWGTLINLVGCVLGNLIIFVAMVFFCWSLICAASISSSVSAICAVTASVLLCSGERKNR